MIKVRFVTQENLEQGQVNGSPLVHYNVVNESGFYHILNEGVQPPFRDEYSRRLIKEMGCGKFTDGSDYSLETPEGKIWMGELPENVKYGLTILNHSRQKIYTHTTCWWCGKELEKILSQFPIDILIAIKKSNLPSVFFTDSVILFENYPYEEQQEVNCFCSWKMEKECIKNGILYKKYISSNEFIYDWLADINASLDFLKTLRTDRRMELIPTVSTHTFQEFDELLQKADRYMYSITDCDYTWNYGYLSEHRGEEWYEEVWKRSLQTREYKEYRYWLDQVEIVNHLVYRPEDSHRKYPLILYVKRRADNSYVIGRGLAGKHPSFESAFYDVREPMKEEHAMKVAVILNIEQWEWYKVEEIQDVYFGMKITRNQIELFEKEDALIEFRNLLEEAVKSENCFFSDIGD